MHDSSKNYLAVDFGAESGRAVVGRLQAKILTIEEVHRFPNEPVEYGGSLHWDVPRLWLQVRKALTMSEHFRLAGIGVDAWGVDYALLGERGELPQNPYHYHDFYAQRTLTKRPILPQDCANAIVWLAGEQSGKTTGHIIPVDGGLSEAYLR